MIHPTAQVAPGAEIGGDVSIGPFSIIMDDVSLGDGTVVQSHCVLGERASNWTGARLQVGSHSTIRSHSILYAGSTLGEGLVTGHHAMIREGTHSGDNLQVGSLSDIQGDCSFGDFVRLHSNVHVGKGSTIGDFVWLFPYVVLTNDPHPPSHVFKGCSVEDWAVIATGSVVLPGVTVGKDALVGAMSLVRRDVPEGAVVAGVPARVLGDAADIPRQDGSGEPAYPWRHHFARGYPEEIVDSERWTSVDDS